ncbi:TolC family protein [Sandaracinus amylolyticus]|uniref:TolC family protein n=1 Tax=Sandaracinus amylolyticus TaxID=927083 RepID=UPI001F4522AF|nr:TolC family protein [Sandaracinus amylolyticus]UJR86134.1 Hypothetical protein I5071_82150 [Sandaracinus amylolyticus]
MNRWIAIVAVLMVTAPVHAQTSDVLSPDGVVSLAAEQSPTLRAALLERRRASQLVLSEEARYTFVLGMDASLDIGDTPSLTSMGVAQSYHEQVVLGAQLSRAFEWGMSMQLRVAGARQFRRAILLATIPTPIAIGPGYSFDVTLGVTQSLLRNGWERNGLATLRQARVELDAATASRNRAASELVRDALSAYWELWYARQALEVDVEARRVAERQHADANARRELGSVAGADVLSFARQLAAMEETVAAAEGELRARQLELGRVIGGDRSSALDPHDDAPALPAPRDADVIAIAIERSPELFELEMQVRSAEEAERTAGAQLEPRLDLSGELGLHGMGYDDAGEPFAQVGRFAAVTGMISLEFEMPLDDAQRRAQLERASLAIEVAERRLEAARDRVRAEAATLLDRASVARRRLALADETVRIAEELARAEQERFELGASTPTVVLEAQSELRNAQRRRLRAMIDLVSADLQIAHATGELLDDVAISDE